MKLSQKTTLWIVFLLASISIAFSGYSEYINGILPCRLCITQRIIHFALLSTSALGIFSRFTNFAWTLCILLLFISFFVASYHGLIQIGILKDRCSFSENIADISSFKRMLEKPHVPCSTISLHFLNIPISMLNAMSSLLIFCFLFAVKKIQDSHA